MKLKKSAHFLIISVLSISLYLPVYGQTKPQRTVHVTLLHVNDVYQISPVDKGTRGGLARVAALRQKIKTESPHTLLLLGGDTISPSVASNIFRGQQIIATWNAVGLDYSVLGNHEFDFGPDVLRERMKESHFVWLAANAVDKKTGKPFGGMSPYVIRTFDGVKIGFFGLIIPDTAHTSTPGPNVKFLDPFQTAKRIVSQMRARGVKIVVAITHLNMSQDKQLARAAPIDLIVGGHEHTLLQAMSGRTPIFKMGSDARNVGRIDLNIAAGRGTLESIDWEVIPVTNDIPDEPQTAAIISEFEKKLSAELDKPVGRTKVELDARQQSNRTRETNLGDFIADAFRTHVGADMAILNSGSIRSNTTYQPGQLTQRDVRSILPFENPVVKIEVSGAVLRTALEHGLSRVVEDLESGAFLQVSGLRFTFDARRPAGSRVVDVTAGGQPLEDKKMYTLASNAYLLNGGDGYSMFRGVRYFINPEEGAVDFSVLADAIAAAGEIAPQTDGRIQRLDEPK